MSGGASGDLLTVHGTGDVDILNTLGIGGSITKASGQLDIRADNLQLKNAASGATYASFTNGGAAELNHNNTKRLETTSGGVNVVGTLTVNGSSISRGGGLTSDADGNTIAGSNAGDNFNSGQALGNTLFGFDAGTDIDNGDKNSFFGYQAGANATDAKQCVAVGYQALYSVGASRSYQTAVGYQALYSNAHGQECTAVGFQALYSNNSGDDQCAFGVYSLKNSNGADILRSVTSHLWM